MLVQQGTDRQLGEEILSVMGSPSQEHQLTPPRESQLRDWQGGATKALPEVALVFLWKRIDV